MWLNLYRSFRFCMKLRFGKSLGERRQKGGFVCRISGNFGESIKSNSDRSTNTKHYKTNSDQTPKASLTCNVESVSCDRILDRTCETSIKFSCDNIHRDQVLAVSRGAVALAFPAIASPTASLAVFWIAATSGPNR